MFLPQSEDGLLFSNTSHDIRLVTMLNADEYLFVKNESESLGISQSLFVRQLINQEKIRLAQDKLSLSQPQQDSAEHAQVFTNESQVNVLALALATLIKPHLGIK